MSRSCMRLRTKRSRWLNGLDKGNRIGKKKRKKSLPAWKALFEPWAGTFWVLPVKIYRKLLCFLEILLFLPGEGSQVRRRCCPCGPWVRHWVSPPSVNFFLVPRRTYPPSHFHILVCFWTDPWLIWAVPECRGWWCSLFPLAGWLWRRCKTACLTRREWGTKEKMVSVASCPPLVCPSP